MKYPKSMPTSSYWIQHHQTSGTEVRQSISQHFLVQFLCLDSEGSSSNQCFSSSTELEWIPQEIRSLLNCGSTEVNDFLTCWYQKASTTILQAKLCLLITCGFWKIFIVIPCSLFSFLSLLGTVPNQQHRKLAPSSDYQRRQSHLRSEYFLLSKI